jgi:hypothetical protein
LDTREILIVSSHGRAVQSVNRSLLAGLRDKVLPETKQF